MNRIRITYKEWKMIQKAVPKPSKLLSNDKKFCFNDFEIQVDIGKGYPLKAEIHLKDNTILEGRIKYYSILRGKYLEFNWRRDGNGTQFDSDVEVLYDKEKLRREVNLYYVILIGCVSYIMLQERDIIYKDRQPKEVKPENKRSIREKHKETLYLLNDIIKYNGEVKAAAKHHKINCESWNVKGHYRHYKSGKVVFIAEYKKGKNRENKDTEDREYRLRRNSL